MMRSKQAIVRIVCLLLIAVVIFALEGTGTKKATASLARPAPPAPSLQIRMWRACEGHMDTLTLRLRNRFDETTLCLSKIFGNFVGEIYLDKPSVQGAVRVRVHAEMMELLKPGDLLLDKTSCKLTDKLIPGYFSHAAMWLGTTEEMGNHQLFEEKGNLFSYEKAQAYKERLRNGHFILEARRPGVQCNNLKNFLNLDVVVVIRLKQTSGPAAHQKLITEVLQRGVAHLGQHYDFNFDLSTPNRVICSELIYRSYPGSAEWPRASKWGRPTVSPDNLAVLAGPGEAYPFEVIYFHTRGKSLKGEEAWRAHWKVMKAEGSLPQASTPFLTRLRKSIESLKP